jgi:endonuclease YncB( thermonuclease family)
MKKIHTVVYAAVIALLAFSAAEASPRQEVVHGPMTGQVLGVLDGDTLSVKLHVWIGQQIETSVRLDGVDAPEMKGKCKKERVMAEAAKQELTRLLSSGEVRIYDIRLEKYAGRVLAKAQTTEGINVGQHMIEKGFARAYHGEKRKPWCLA